MTDLRLYPATNGPTTYALAGAGGAVVGLEFTVTTGSWWIKALHLWRGSWDLVGPVPMAVYQVLTATTGTLLSGTAVDLDVHGLGWLTATLPTLVPIVAGQAYRLGAHVPHGVNTTSGYWSSGPGSAGITNGALSAPSEAASTGGFQSPAAPAAALAYPSADGAGATWWLDVTVTDDPATAGASPLAAAADAADQEPRTLVVIDWDRSGAHPLADVSPAVTRLTVERAVTGGLPAQVSLIEGEIAAELELTLGGQLADGTDTFTALAQWQAGSPLYLAPIYGAPVTADLGLATDAGAQLERQFTGRLRALECDSGSRTVRIVALDPAEGVRAPITLPAAGMQIGDAIAIGDRWAMPTQAVIDFVLRKNAIYASPAPHPDAQISATGHGWLAAEVGRSAVPRISGASVPAADAGAGWTAGPFDMLAVAGSWATTQATYQEFFGRQPHTPVAGTGVGIGAWVRVGNNMGLPAGEYRALFQLFPLLDHAAFRYELGIWANGSLGGYILANGFAQSIATTAQWMYIGVHFQNMTNGQTRIRYRQNSTTTFGDIATPALTSTVAPFLQCTAWIFRDWSNFHVWYDPNPPAGAWPGESHTPQARIDPGYNLLTHLPDIVNRDSWDVIKECAEAEYGLVGFNRYGVFEFRDRTAVDPTTVQKTISTDRGLRTMGTAGTTDSVRNIITTETTAAYLHYPAVIFATRDVLEFQSPVGVSEYLVPLPYGAIGFSTITLPRQPNASWTDQTPWGYVSVQAAAPTVEITSGITVTLTMAADRLAVLTVRNFSDFPVRFATTSGSPALRAVGWALIEEPARTEEVRSPGSVELYGPRALPIPASPWRQLTAPLSPVAGGLLATLSNPLPALDEIQVNGDPTLQTGHTVRLVDSGGIGSLRGAVVKIRRTLDGALTDALSTRPLAGPALGIADDPESLADSTMIAAP